MGKAICETSNEERGDRCRNDMAWFDGSRKGYHNLERQSPVIDRCFLLAKENVALLSVFVVLTTNPLVESQRFQCVWIVGISSS